MVVVQLISIFVPDTMLAAGREAKRLHLIVVQSISIFVPDTMLAAG
jgi:hypothetical protein